MDLIKDIFQIIASINDQKNQRGSREYKVAEVTEAK